ncbi:hypothetical protein F9863_11695, partial [Glaesserella parasuis]|nr:hypothetical protein [Glaesserella parasuis]
VKPPVTLPPVIANPPITKPPATGTSGCSPPPAAKKTCPLDILKFGACLDLLGNVIQIGDPTVSECCPLIKGLTGIEAAVCLCTTIKLKLLNIYVLYPIAVDLLISCGKTPPPGYTCY